MNDVEKARMYLGTGIRKLAELLTVAGLLVDSRSSQTIYAEKMQEQLNNMMEENGGGAYKLDSSELGTSGKEDIFPEREEGFRPGDSQPDDALSMDDVIDMMNEDLDEDDQDDDDGQPMGVQ